MAVISETFCYAGLDSLLIPVNVEDLVEKQPTAPVIDTAKDAEVEEIPEKYTLTIQDLLPALKNSLVTRYQVDGNLRIYPLRSWRGRTLNSPVWDLEITNAPSPTLTSKILIGFQILSEGEIVGEWQMPLRCEVWREVFVTRQRMNRGSPLARTDLDILNMNTLRVPNAIVSPDVELSEYELAQTVSEGQPLLLRDIAPKPLIRKGQVVEVVAAEGGMRISMKGQALEDGIREAFISIRNLNSRKNIQAQVIDDNKVKVYF